MMIKKIDAVTRHDHIYLTKRDKCYYFGEYTSGTGFAHSPTNSLIFNFKKPMSVKGTAQWKYKIQAIKEAIKLLAAVKFPKPKKSILVPIPPSKVQTNPAYDGRVSMVLKNVSKQLDIEFRELIKIKKDMDAFHESDAPRPMPSQLISNLEIDEDFCEEMKPYVYLVDDVITTGSHFKACKNLINSRFPDVIVQGIFLARRSF